MRAPWHLWVVGGLSLLWNAMGAFDYTMTQTRNAAYLEGFTPEQLDYFLGFPAWVVFFWALAVWGSVAGSLLLLLRRAPAVPVLAVSFLSMLVVTVQNYLLSETSPAGIMGPEAAAFAGVIFVVALLLWVYAVRIKRAGVLR